MNPSVKAKWIEALRSGDYKQAVGRLRWQPTGGFCCMGVLCDLYLKETGIGSWDYEETDPTQVGQISGGLYTFMGMDGYPPSNVLSWAGLKSPREDEQLFLISKLNDHDKKSFKVISDFIEANF